jgi:signal transduction histidine kinase/HD-like signal output (HDOD) protein
MTTPTNNARARQVEMILQQVDTLPTLSPVATRLLSIGSDNDADLDEVVMLIESDPALTSKILSLCRRADKGLGQSVSTVKKAVIMLGLEAVQGAVLSVCVYELLDQAGNDLDEQRYEKGQEGAGLFDRRGFWKHSVAVACASDLIAAKHPELGVKADEAFIAGLLHDTGKLVLELVLPQSYAKVLGLIESRQEESAAIERSIIGIDHHTAGKRIGERWQFPQGIQDVIWLHSQPIASLPDELTTRNLVGVVTAAKSLCRQLYIGWSGEHGRPQPLHSICADVGLDQNKIESITQTLHEAVADRCSALGIDDETSPELLLQSIGRANQQLSRINSTLERRSRLADQLTRAIDAVEAFHDHGATGASVFDVISRIVRSAGGVLGDGFFGVVFQPSSAEPWHAYRFSADGRLIGSELIDPPAGAQNLASIVDGARVNALASAVLPWLDQVVAETPGADAMRIIPLTDRDESSTDRPTAMLLHAHDPSRIGLDKRQMRVLASTWSAAFSAAARQEQAVRLGEQLAETNRTLAEAQDKLTESESLARLGEMTAGAAHEMNNPLTVISGRSQLLADRLPDARDRAAAAAVFSAAQELSDLITSLHLLADPPTPEPVRTNSLDMLSKAVARAKTRTGGGAQVHVTVPRDLPPMNVDAELIGKAVVELIANAIESRPRTGVETWIEIEGDQLKICVADDGCGMSPKAQRHAFDPFFSEKAAGRQCGLGLARARRLVELHGGRITIESEPEQGTVARISLDEWRCVEKADLKNPTRAKPAA